MNLASIDIANLRNIESGRITPTPRLNFIVGANASGKTSLLEAIYLLGRARSFRTTQVNQLIRFGQPSLTVSGKLREPNQALRSVGVRLARGQREIRLAGKALTSSAELARAFPVLIIQPAGISLLDGPPKQRRQFVDFGAFHEDAEYLALWRRFIESLSQRNALLRERRLRELAPWTHEAARCGTILTEARKRYVERIMPVFSELGELFFPGRRFDLRFQPGWDDSHSLQSVLDAEVSGDARLGFTRCGPHKADVTIGCDGRTAKVHLSRGQTKLLVYGLQLAQARLMEQRGGTPACVLIDDIASELDDRNRDLLLEFLVAGTTQYFVTSTTLVGVESKLPPDSALIGIEQGQLTQA